MQNISEIEELINADGSMANSKVPILDPKLHPKKTMDQTVPAARITNDPVTRGYRVYYGESVEEVDEEDMSKAFGYQETSGKTPDQTIKILHKMGVENPVERTNQFGKLPKQKVKKDKSKTYRISGGLLTMHGKDKKDLELTTEEKTAFQETMDEFVDEVSDLSDFGVLNLSNSNVRFGLGNNSGTYTGYCGLSSFYTYTIVSGSNNTYINIQNTGSGYVIC